MNIINKEGIILRAIEQEDMQLMKDLINDPEIEKMVVGWSFPVSSYKQINWINNLSNDTSSVRFIIDIKNVGAIGLASLSSIDFKNGTATVNIKLKKEEKIRNKGIGYKVITMLIDYAFRQLNLNCLVANILYYNSASQRLFEKCGFVCEGTLRNRVYKEGAYQDLLSYSLLRSEHK
ncbi:GNAT family N-acetyltransferase [Bacillus sp. E214]|uniref:GNAT family N-acetyltransferase n=1 Tax=Bacillus sp. E214 TaxID=2587156 RepID=UPI0011DF53CB|nr:GNAT family protein [Bacillus sp. E214]